MQSSIILSFPELTTEAQRGRAARRASAIGRIVFLDLPFLVIATLVVFSGSWFAGSAAACS